MITIKRAVNKRLIQINELTHHLMDQMVKQFIDIKIPQ